MNTHYQIQSGFEILSRVVKEFKEIAKGDKGPDDSSQSRKLHKLRRHAEIFGGFTEAYLDEAILRKHRLERVLNHEQSFSRTQHFIAAENP